MVFPFGYGPSRSCEHAQLLAQHARRYALACALALGLELDYFVRTLARMDCCTLRFLHYPPCAAPTAADGVVEATPIRVGEHTDFGAFTFLLLGEGAQGLVATREMTIREKDAEVRVLFGLLACLLASC